MRIFSKNDLAGYNGKDGDQIFVAYRGKVYDMSASFLWRNGNHQVLHNAGQDLTDAMTEAPHGDEFFDVFPVVGLFQEE